MKHHAFAEPLGLLARLGPSAGFLAERKETVGLSPLWRRAQTVYVWRRVLLRGRERRA